MIRYTGGVSSSGSTHRGGSSDYFFVFFFEATGDFAGAVFFAAHRAFNAATIRARPSGLRLRLAFFTALVVDLTALSPAVSTAVTAAAPFFLAHRACWAAFIFRIVAGDIVRLPPRFPLAGDDTTAGVVATKELPPTMLASSAWSISICSAMVTACLSWATVGVGISVVLRKQIARGQRRCLNMQSDGGLHQIKVTAPR